MSVPSACLECKANLPEGHTCEEYFHQMLFWENEFPAYGEVHHLMVLGYYLQHPSLYSPDGLKYAQGLLRQFVDEGQSPLDVRQNNRAEVASNNRQWKIKATLNSKGSYPQPVKWTMTAAEVVLGGAEHYCDNVRKWSQSIRADLEKSGNTSAYA